MAEKTELEKFRTRWRRWLGNKTRRDAPHWVTLLASNWMGWVEQVYAQCGLDYTPLGFTPPRETVKAVWLVAINQADMRMLRRLDGLYAADKIGL